MDPRNIAGAVLASAGAFSGILLAPQVDPYDGVPAMLAGGLALAAVVSWPRTKPLVTSMAAMAAAVSLAATAGVLTSGRAGTGASGLIGFVEIGGLLLLLALVVRWAPRKAMVLVAGPTAAAAIVWILRYLPELDPLAIIGGCGSMAVAAALAIAVGGYPRAAAVRLDWSVRSARQAQRLEIAHDLHDYIAHDVTAIVATAQAARYALGDDPARLAAALARIETVGLQALSAMDEMVAVLADHDATAPPRRPTDLGGLPDLIDGFSSERGASCRVDFAQDVRAADPSSTSRQVQATAHRVVVEALTNVRRHAPAATRVAVTVDVRDLDDHLVVTVTNDLGASGPLRRRSSTGTGLLNLRKRVQTLGGQLAAGPVADGGWVVQAHIPRNQRGEDD